MNRIEIVGLFTAMEALVDEKNYDALAKTIKVVLKEARNKPEKGDKDED